MEEVVNIRDNDAYDVYIGRRLGDLKGSIWANPFKVSQYGRGNTIDKYKAYLKQQPKLLEQLPKLSGKRLGCWCKPEACHGDVLALYAHKSDDKCRLVVSGSRSLQDQRDFVYVLISDIITEHLQPKYKQIVVIEGGAKGVDTIAKDVAIDLSLEQLTIPAIWEVDGKLDKSAGYKRNEVLLKLADQVLVIWDGKSPGSKHMIKRATDLGLDPRVIKVGLF